MAVPSLRRTTLSSAISLLWRPSLGELKRKNLKLDNFLPNWISIWNQNSKPISNLKIFWQADCVWIHFLLLLYKTYDVFYSQFLSIKRLNLPKTYFAILQIITKYYKFIEKTSFKNSFFGKYGHNNNTNDHNNNNKHNKGWLCTAWLWFCKYR